MIFCCLWGYFALAVWAAAAKSPTNDEAVHILRGYAIWQGDLRWQHGHPPLTHRLIGLLLPAEPTLPALTSLPAYPYGDRLQLAAQLLWGEATMAHIPRILLLSRFPIILAGLLFVAALTRWAKTRYPNGYMLIPILAAFSPNLLAHTSLAATDGAIIIVFPVAIIGLRHFCHRPNQLRAILAGLGLGAAFAIKISALILAPIAVMALFWLWRAGRLTLWQAVGRLAAMGLIAGSVIWAATGFEVRNLPALNFPVPAAVYLDNFVTVQGHINNGHAAFLLGESSQNGWLGYFFIAFLAKVPTAFLPAFILTLSALTYFRQWRATVWLWLPALLFFAAASWSRLNIGVRHILPVFPLLWLMVVHCFDHWKWGGRWALAAFFGVWYVGETMWQAPHFLAYFNQFVGGSPNGHLILGDSNIDWGQDLWALGDYAQERPVRVAYSGFPEGARYELDVIEMDEGTGVAADFAPANPDAGMYAISVNQLQGTLSPEPDLFDYFRRGQPIGRLGYSIRLYQAPPQRLAAWAAHCALPGALLTEETTALLINQAELRHVYFDCENSWLIPNGGAGYYIVPRNQSAPILPASIQPSIQLIYSHNATQALPAFDVYYYASQPELMAAIEELPAIVEVDDGQAAQLPLAVGDAAQLLGYWEDAYKKDAGSWGTIWRLGRAENGLSILAHLYQPPDGLPSVGDGLDFTSDQWQLGDILFQRHPFADAATNCPDPANSSQETPKLATGLYNYVTGDRLPIEDGDQVLLFGCLTD